MVTTSMSTGMADLYMTGKLKVSSDDEVLLDLECTNGQPLHSRVSKFRIRGETAPISRFKGNVQRHSLGMATDISNHTLRIFCTLHDSRDLTGNKPLQDIRLRVKVKCGASVSEHLFVYPAQGSGEIITCVYEVAMV